MSSLACNDALKALGAISVAPLIGLAYVLLLPFVGVGVLLAANLPGFWEIRTTQTSRRM